MLVASRAFARPAGSLLARSALSAPSSRASSSALPEDSTASGLSDAPSTSHTLTPALTTSPSSVPSPSGYFITGPPRAAVVRQKHSAPSPFALPSSPHRTHTNEPSNLNLNAFVLPSTPHSPLALLNSQTSRYIVASLHSRKFLMHPRDILTVPKLVSLPPIGSQLTLTRVFEVGSRDFALKAPKGQRLLDVQCKLTVLEHTTGPMEIVDKKKRRKGYQRRIRSKMQYTRLRVGEMELVGEGTRVGEDEKPPERRLRKLLGSKAEAFGEHDNSLRGRMAREFGKVHPKEREAPPRPQ